MHARHEIPRSWPWTTCRELRPPHEPAASRHRYRCPARCLFGAQIEESSFGQCAIDPAVAKSVHHTLRRSIQFIGCKLDNQNTQLQIATLAVAARELQLLHGPRASR